MVLDEVEDGAVGGFQRVDVVEVAAEGGGAALEVDAVCLLGWVRMGMFVGLERLLVLMDLVVEETKIAVRL